MVAADRFLMDRYGDIFGTRVENMTAADYVGGWGAREGADAAGDPPVDRPYIFHSVTSAHDPLLKGFPTLFPPFLSDPAARQLVDISEPKAVQFFLGQAGSGAPIHFHCDAWNTIAHGSKRWILSPPSSAIFSKKVRKPCPLHSDLPVASSHLEAVCSRYCSGCRRITRRHAHRPRTAARLRLGNASRRPATSCTCRASGAMRCSTSKIRLGWRSNSSTGTPTAPEAFGLRSRVQIMLECTLRPSLRPRQQEPCLRRRVYNGSVAGPSSRSTSPQPRSRPPRQSP